MALFMASCRPRVAAKARFRKMVGHNDRGVKSNGDKLEEELSEVRLEMTKCVAGQAWGVYVSPPAHACYVSCRSLT